LSVTDAVRRCCCPLDNHAAFPPFGAEAENGFVAGENCFVAAAGRNNSVKICSYFKPMGQSFGGPTAQFGNLSGAVTIGGPQNRADSKPSLLFNFSGGEDPRPPSNRNISPAVSIR